MRCGGWDRFASLRSSRYAQVDEDISHEYKMIDLQTVIAEAFTWFLGNFAQIGRGMEESRELLL
jgi:hypothetical protein